MDPYLEQFWGDVHASLIVYIRDQINEQLPGDLRASGRRSDGGYRIVFVFVEKFESPKLNSSEYRCRNRC